MGKYKVDIPFVDTNNIKVLKNDEMLELFKKYNDGDMLAKEELINGNLKLVLSILKKSCAKLWATVLPPQLK